MRQLPLVLLVCACIDVGLPAGRRCDATHPCREMERCDTRGICVAKEPGPGGGDGGTDGGTDNWSFADNFDNYDAGSWAIGTTQGSWTVVSPQAEIIHDPFNDVGLLMLNGVAVQPIVQLPRTLSSVDVRLTVYASSPARCGVIWSVNGATESYAVNDFQWFTSTMSGSTVFPNSNSVSLWVQRSATTVTMVVNGTKVFTDAVGAGAFQLGLFSTDVCYVDNLTAEGH